VRIAIGSDHRGFALKEALKELLAELGHEWVDFGCQTEEPVDYPDIARPVAEAVAAGEYERGILVCGSGVGMSIAADKVRGVRAALCDNGFTARLARRHNDANVLCVSSWCIGRGLAEDIVRVFLSEDFEGGRHARRLEKIRAMEP
jgi:ribose 5-phosphate isomerase B